MLKCVIIDDEQHAINILAAFIAELPDVKLMWSTTNAVENIDRLHQEGVDLIFLDINMPKISGFELMKLIKKSGYHPNFIFTTAYSEYAVQGFEYEAVDYLLKPIAFDRFLRAVQKVRLLLPQNAPGKEQEGKNYIFVKVDSKNNAVKINFKDILYIEGLKNYVSIFTTTERTVALLNMKDLEDCLPKQQFLRVHRSYIIPMERIKSINGNRIFLTDCNDVIPIGETYRSLFADFLSKNSIR
jgi:DNA-binding LytR/AlgR family response regulator